MNISKIIRLDSVEDFVRSAPVGWGRTKKDRDSWAFGPDWTTRAETDAGLLAGVMPASVRQEYERFRETLGDAVVAVAHLLRQAAQVLPLQDAPAVGDQDEIIAIPLDLMERHLLHVFSR